MGTTGLIVAVAGALLLLAGPSGVRAGWWSYIVGFGLLGVSLLLALAAIVLLIVSARRGNPAITAAGIALAVAVIAIPTRFIWSARATPPIHDISTDLADPPSFDAILSLRGASASPIVPPPDTQARQQRRAYPDIEPLDLPVPAMEAFNRALAAAHALRWTVVTRDPVRGRIEAVDTTRWFGFKDDVVVRVRDTSAGARIDVRSTSRVGIGDAGTNARRIRLFLQTLRDN